MPIKNIIIAGATGNLGSGILHALLQSPSKFSVSVLTRSPSLPTPGVRVLQTDYTAPSLTQTLNGQDAVISTLGAAATMTQAVLIDAAVAAGVKVFIPSDFAPYSPDLSEIERLVPELGIRLNWTAIGSGPLFDWTLKTGFLGISLPLHTATIIDSGTTPYLTTTIPQIGRAIGSVLAIYNKSDFSSHSTLLVKNKYLLITSFTTTQNKVLACCEEITGEKFGVERVSSEDRGKEGREMLDRGDFRGIGRLWNVWGHADVLKGEEREILKRELANGLLGLPVESMVDVIRGLV